MLSFKTTNEDAELIHQIAARASEIAVEYGHSIPKQQFAVDLTACCASGCPLRLAELLAADKLNFTHDVFGIGHHISRQTGKLSDCFVPRYAVDQ